MEKVVRWFVLIAFALAFGLHVAPKSNAQEKSAGTKTTVTGCLQKGDEPGEYSITGEDGKRYGLRSKNGIYAIRRLSTAQIYTRVSFGRMMQPTAHPHATVIR